MTNNPKRSVESNELHSTDLPRLRVQVDSAFDYIGNFKSTILDTIHIDNYYFVDRNADGQIRRILYFQFEEQLPDSDDQFVYPTMQPIELQGNQFGYDGGVRMYRQSRVNEQPDDSDVRQTVDFLKKQSAQFAEGEYYGTLRFAKILDDTKRNDLLILYLERLEESEIPEDIIAKSRHSDEWSVYCNQLLARALRTFTICED